MGIRDHSEKIEAMRKEIAGLLAQNKRQEAKVIGSKMNVLICLQYRREGKVVRSLTEWRA